MSANFHNKHFPLLFHLVGFLTIAINTLSSGLSFSSIQLDSIILPDLKTLSLGLSYSFLHFDSIIIPMSDHGDQLFPASSLENMVLFPPEYGGSHSVSVYLLTALAASQNSKPELQIQFLPRILSPSQRRRYQELKAELRIQSFPRTLSPSQRRRCQQWIGSE